MATSEPEGPGVPSPLAGDGERADADSPWRLLRDAVLVRLLLYYIVVVAAARALTEFVPGLREALDLERERHVVMGGEVSNSLESALPNTTDLFTDWTWAAVLVSLLSALLLSLPVSWVYGWTTRKKLYNQTFAQSLVVFPIAIATVVFLVKGSLALAFSLAGIVAAIRFRSTLSETRDAIFLFITIGIGLAAGVQLMLVALVASVVFNVVAILLASSNYGSRPSKLTGLMLEPQRAGKKKAR